MRWLWLAVGATVAWPACAARRPVVDPLVPALAAIDRADRRLRDGCYACLREARDSYAGLADSPLAGLASRRLFDAELLIVLREQELTIDTSASLDRLARAGSALPADAGYDVPRLLTRLRALLPQAPGLSDAAYGAFVDRHRGDAATADADLAWLATSPLYEPVRDYLALAIRCNPISRANPRVTPPPAPPPPAASTLVAYRGLVCAGQRGLAGLTTLYGEHPELAEAAYYLSVTEALQTNGPTSRKRALTEAAYAAFPLSPSVTYAMGIVRHSAGNCREAVTHYDETLALAPRHESAQLGRAACLSHLKRPADAIEAATQLIDWNSTKLLEAYYWRAYNERLQEHLDLARADIDASKQRGSTSENRTLAGVIEYEQDDLTPAVDDLNRGYAIAMGRNCTAAWYLGLVSIKRGAWADAAGGFERATACYARNVSDDEASLITMEQTPDLDPDFRASQIAGFKAAILEDQRQQRASALNTAISYANTGALDRARPFLRVAALEPAYADQLRELEAFIASQAADAAPAPGGAASRPPIQ